ncbi:hypothetical protein ACJ5NV_04625 [Loktanella agnita]|uniref:hypothetical protein n=1 Tax=Loktanella agnita TaxID=287097 RepID=UPI0039871643
MVTAISQPAVKEGHTRVAYEHAHPMKMYFKVIGPLIWLDEAGEPDGYFDVHQYIEGLFRQDHTDIPPSAISKWPVVKPDCAEAR